MYSTTLACHTLLSLESRMDSRPTRSVVETRAFRSPGALSSAPSKQWREGHKKEQSEKEGVAGDHVQQSMQGGDVTNKPNVSENKGQGILG